MKGIEMPVNTVIIVALAIMVLLMLAMFFFGGTRQMSATSLESAWSQGCSILKSHNCEADKVEGIMVADITGDGIKDSLLLICRAKYQDDTVSEYWCRNKCCGTVIVEGTSCSATGGVGDKECQMGFGRSTWKCNTAKDGNPDPACCPDAKQWSQTSRECE